MEHPGDEALLRFLLGMTSRHENRTIVRHLLARCPACAKTLNDIWKGPPPDTPAAPEIYDQALDRFQEQLRIWLNTKSTSTRPTMLSAL
jgi:hypothetical protein